MRLAALLLPPPKQSESREHESAVASLVLMDAGRIAISARLYAATYMYVRSSCSIFSVSSVHQSGTILPTACR